MRDWVAVRVLTVPSCSTLMLAPSQPATPSHARPTSSFSAWSRSRLSFPTSTWLAMSRRPAPALVALVQRYSEDGSPRRKREHGVPTDLSSVARSGNRVSNILWCR
jgi:hypothetical protein